jgi:hypothetical protein
MDAVRCYGLIALYNAVFYFDYPVGKLSRLCLMCH